MSSTTAAVSIVVPVHNDEDWIATALESCIRQTLEDIEIICVDDASTDSTCAVIERLQERDARIRLLRSEVNRSAFQARRMGVEAASAPYVLFLDGDDELAADAAQTTVDQARVNAADIVGFGVDVVMPDGTTASTRFEASLQPGHRELSGAAIVPALFPPGQVAQGHVWRYLYSRELLREAYSGFPDDLALFRANDIPIAFLAIAGAKKYVSTPDRLYRYFFRRGRSGHRVEDINTFGFYLGAVDSIESIEHSVRLIASRLDDEAAASLVASYESARLSTVAGVLRYCLTNAAPDLRADCIALLSKRVGEFDVVRASATFCRDALPLLTRHIEVPESRRPVRNVLLTTHDLRTGGLQGVIVAQARYLAANGLGVTIAVHSLEGAVHDLPVGVRLIEVAGNTPADKLDAWVEICREHEVDVIIDHHVLYNRSWPPFVLAARMIGVATIGWIHSFSLRPIYEFDTRTSFLRENLPLLRTVVVLSKEDVSFWKLLGVANVVWLPNPPSPLLLNAPPHQSPKRLPEGAINLVWWGRLQQQAKQVRDLIAVAGHLRRLEVEFRLTIIGPDTSDLTAAQLYEAAIRHGVADAVQLPGPLHGADLLDALSRADLLVFTSVIEGNPLTVMEAQAMGMPVVMYELPWVEGIKANRGVVTVRQGDTEGLAREIALLSQDPTRYTQLSEASLVATANALSLDMQELYGQMLADELAPEFSPEPSLDDASLLLDRILHYSERNARVQRRATDRFRRYARTQRQDSDRLRHNVRRLRGELRGVRRSLTFRIGRVVVFVPRELAQLVLAGVRAMRGPAATTVTAPPDMAVARASNADTDRDHPATRPSAQAPSSTPSI